MKQKGFTPIFILIVIVIAVSAGFLLKNQKDGDSSTAIPTSTSITESKVKWETLSDQDFGFSIQYPSNLKLSKYVDKGKTYLIQYIGDNCIQVYSYPVETAKLIENPDSIIHDYFTYSNLKVGESAVTTFPERSRAHDDGFTTTYTRLEDVNIGGYDWFQLDVTNSYENHGSLPRLYLNNKNRIWAVSQTFGSVCSKEEIDSMLSTFKFTE